MQKDGFLGPYFRTALTLSYLFFWGINYNFFSLNFFHGATQPLNTPGAQNCQIASYTIRRTMTIQHNGKTQMIHFAERCPVPSTKLHSAAHWNIQ